MATIKVRVSPAGQTEIEVEGVNGQGCTKLTEVIELQLGGGASTRTEKPEYHMPDSTHVGGTLTF